MNYFQHRCSWLVNALLPQRCALCECTTGTRSPICPACEAKLPSLPALCCPCCADFSPAGTICGHCLSTPPAFDAVMAPFLYADPIDRLVQSLKYGHQLWLAGWFGERIAADLATRREMIGHFDAIIPLPLHPKRMQSRGFNQAMEIARPIARRLKLPILSDAAFRTRDTLPQADLSRDERHQNIRNAFECRTDFGGKSLLVIDDVLTTGSSASELARVLKLHCARQVVVAVTARTHHH